MQGGWSFGPCVFPAGDGFVWVDLLALTQSWVPAAWPWGLLQRGLLHWLQLKQLVLVLQVEPVHLSPSCLPCPAAPWELALAPCLGLAAAYPLAAALHHLPASASRLAAAYHPHGCLQLKQLQQLQLQLLWRLESFWNRAEFACSSPV